MTRAASVAPAVPFLLLLVAAPPAPGQAAGESGRPVHTFSIVARDPATGELGVAVQSHWYSVGALVPWAEAGVGAVATQSFIDVSYGPLGLELMRAGKTAPEALRALLAADAHPDVRQVAMVDARGNLSAWTGENAIIEAGHVEGEQFSVQANLMLSADVWPAMAAAYRSASGDLAERLLAALDAAQAAGGDIRGRQSAAILIVRGQSTGRPWDDKVMDLRVEDSPEPLRELRRLVNLQRAYAHMNAGDARMTENDVDGAVAEYGAAETIAPEVSEMTYWHAATLAGAGRVEESLPLFERAFAADPNWAVLTARLPSAGLLPKDDALIRRILAVHGGEPGLAEIARLQASGRYLRAGREAPPR
ncbi:MAG TPA: DUF1028 domain-containing protein [Gemmatimonadota bacterium]|jgi:uncharacterized Ntn-hydrolase superfamily protein